MENLTEIKEGIAKLVSGQIFAFALSVILITVTITVILLALKFKLLTVKSKLPLVLAVFLCSALLICAQLVRAVPILQDHREVSYTLAENATLVVQEGTTGIVHRTNNVTVITADGEKIRLRIEDGSDLVVGAEYVGQVAYTNRSGYVVWFDLTETSPTDNADGGKN